MASNKKRSPRIGFLAIIAAVIFGFGLYQKTGDISAIYAGLAIVCLIIFLLLFERKVRISDPGELSVKAENRLDGIWAGAFFLLGVVCIANMYGDFAMQTVIIVAALLVIGIIARFVVKKKK
jgi:drug/metabolite transporter (DMT)-like permease